MNSLLHTIETLDVHIFGAIFRLKDEARIAVSYINVTRTGFLENSAPNYANISQHVSKTKSPYVNVKVGNKQEQGIVLVNFD